MSKIGVYGGSFNPIHSGHIALAEQILHTFDFDEIWFVVSPLNPFKASSAELISDETRFNMVCTALAGHSQLKASDYEFNLPRPSYTWITLQNMNKDYPQHEFTLIIGADNWASFNRWKYSENIIQHYPIMIYPRKHYPVNASLLPRNVQLLDTKMYHVSSSNIRHYVHEGLSIKGLVPDCIIDKVQKLYR